MVQGLSQGRRSRRWVDDEQRDLLGLVAARRCSASPAREAGAHRAAAAAAPRGRAAAQAARRSSQKDCEPVDRPTSSSRSRSSERSIPEGARARRGGEGRPAQPPRAPRSSARPASSTSTDAVEHLITALRADPYNVTATYNLAAAYARIGRKQCAINLLTAPAPDAPASVEARRGRAPPRRCSAASSCSTPTSPTCASDARFRALIAEDVRRHQRRELRLRRPEAQNRER